MLQQFCFNSSGLSVFEYSELSIFPRVLKFVIEYYGYFFFLIFLGFGGLRRRRITVELRKVKIFFGGTFMGCPVSGWFIVWLERSVIEKVPMPLSSIWPV